MRHAREARRRPQPKHMDRCQTATAVGCHKPGERAQHATNHGTRTAARQQPTHTPQTRARSGLEQPKPESEHTHPQRTAQPGVAGRSRNLSPCIHTHTAHPSQEWQGASGARTRAHTQPNTPARTGGAQPKPQPKHTHPSRTPQLGVAEYKGGTHTSTQTPQQPSQEWRGAPKTRAQTHTPTPHPPARSGGVQGGQRTRAHTHPNTPARSGEAQPKPEPKHTHPRRAPQPGVAGCKRSAHTSTHTAQHPSQEWRGAAETRAQTHTATARTPARSGGVQAERPHQHTHTPTARPGVAGRSRNPNPNTHYHGAHCSQEWRAASGAPTPAHTHLNTAASSGGGQPKPEPKYTHPQRAARPGVAGCKRSAHTSTHTAQHPSQECRGAAETPSPNTQTHGAHPSQEWRGASGAPRPAHKQLNSPARSGGAQPKP